MICECCGKEIEGLYIGDTETGEYYCRSCVIVASRKPRQKLDHDAIYRMHVHGASTRKIAEQFGSNPLTIGKIIWEKKKEHGRQKTIV